MRVHHERFLWAVGGLVVGLAVSHWRATLQPKSDMAGQRVKKATPPTLTRLIAPPPPPIQTPVTASHRENERPTAEDEATNLLALRQKHLGENLGRAHFGFMHYAMENGDRFPASLEEMPLRYFKGAPPVIVDPFTEMPMELEYTAGLTTHDSAELVILATPLLQNSKRWIVQVSGSTKIVDEQEYQKLVEGLPALEK